DRESRSFSPPRGSAPPGQGSAGHSRKQGGELLVAEPQRICTYLRYRIGDEPERVVIWDTVEVTVGRMPNQDLVVPDKDVSRQHAVFRCKRGLYSVEDCGPTLGTWRNGERIRTADLEPGDVIEIGSLRVEFQQTQEALRSGGSVRFASELKGEAPAAEEEA